VEAIASMDTLELKVTKEHLKAHLHNILHISEIDKKTSIRKTNINKASQNQPKM
jgi:hypothetical protein